MNMLRLLLVTCFLARGAQAERILLKAATLHIGERGATVEARVYVSPKGKVGGTGKVTREDIGPGTTIQRSSFDLELWQAGKKLSSTRFYEDGDVNQLEARWLRPKERRTPVLLLRFGVGDSGDWLIFTYDAGIYHKPVAQEIGFDGGEDYYSLPRFDSTDSRGYLMVEEHSLIEGKREHHHFRWNGRRFTGLGSAGERVP